MEELSPIGWALRPLRHYADFKGRAPRAEYWWFYLGTIIVGIPLAVMDNVLGTANVLNTIINLALLVPWLAVAVRRLHDTDRSGWWLLLFVAGFAVIGLVAAFGIMGQFGGGLSQAVSFTGMIAAILAIFGLVLTFLVFMILPGTEGSNRYGPDPYGPGDLEQVFA